MNNRNEVNKLKIMSCWIFVVVAIALGIRNVSDNNIDNNKSSVNSSKKNESIEEINNKEGLLAKSRSQEQNKSFSTDSDTLKSNEIKRLEGILNDELFILVNENNKLEDDYVPSTLVESDIAFEGYIECKQLDERTSNAAKEMFNAALNDNVNLIAISGYRGYSVQENLYNSRVEVKGVEKTRQYTAEPGASEHQTGLAIDIVCNDYPYLDEEFENKKENILERYIEVGEKNNKKYSSEIIAGKETLVFETMNLEMTDGQIEKSLKKINNDEFGINIVKDKLGNKPYYKIYLIEANIGL